MSGPRDPSIAAKVIHVQAAGQSRRHHCHWPGCEQQCPPAAWGCKEHWYRLPKDLRDKVWKTYRPGQEIDQKPSPSYIEVAKEVRSWILSEHPELRGIRHRHEPEEEHGAPESVVANRPQSASIPPTPETSPKGEVHANVPQNPERSALKAEDASGQMDLFGEPSHPAKELRAKHKEAPESKQMDLF